LVIFLRNQFTGLLKISVVLEYGCSLESFLAMTKRMAIKVVKGKIINYLSVYYRP
jgi:hypothetical protein